MISLPFRVACILIAGFLIVLAVTYIYKLNSRKVFWGVGLTTIIGILILLGLGVLRPSWGTERKSQKLNLCKKIWFQTTVK